MLPWSELRNPAKANRFTKCYVVMAATASRTVVCGPQQRGLKIATSASNGGQFRQSTIRTFANNPRNNSLQLGATPAAILYNRSFGVAGLPGQSLRLSSNYGTRGTLDTGFGNGSGGIGNGNGSGGFGNNGWWGDDSSDDYNEDASGRLESFLQALLSCYAHVSAKYPVMTSGVLTATSMMVAEAITQLLVLGNPHLNTEPMLRALVYGVFLKGPLLVHFYGALNNVFKCRKGINLLMLLAADCGLGNLMFCTVYAFAMPLLKGFTVNEAAKKCSQDTLGLWSVGIKIWTPAMLLNYLFLPASLQVPYILAVDVLVNIGMTMQARTGIQAAVNEASVEAAPVLGSTLDSVFGESVEVVDAVSMDISVAEAMQRVEERISVSAATAAY